MPVAIRVAPVAFAVTVMTMVPVAVVGVTMVMDAFMIPIAMGVMGVQFSRVGVCSHGNRVRGGVKDGKQQAIVPHSIISSVRYAAHNSTDWHILTEKLGIPGGIRNQVPTRPDPGFYLNGQD